MQLEELGKRCKSSSAQIMNASSLEKNKILETIANELRNHSAEIIEANKKDIEAGIANQMNAGLIDRMKLDQARIEQIIEGIYQVMQLEDPIGEISEMKTTSNGLQIGKMRVALGVVGMIYEARPNVTVDAAILCLKAGNAVMLRGSKDILHSNVVLVSLMRKALTDCGFNKDIITLLEDTSRETATKFMKLNLYLDVLIPRGGANLIKTTVDQATVPVLETGTGNCHVFVDKEADLEKATAIILNGKTTRTSVCNALESVLIHECIADDFTIKLLQKLKEKHVVIHADEYISKLDKECILAIEEDYYKEYLDLEISIKRVISLDEAIHHINKYSTHHSESIISENYTNVKRFLREVDSACVYANASTRFSDGFEFGLGAEIGISTQKLHARGPMGLKSLTNEKFIILGDGQIRN
ncbi:glutamate-5-semialdehyde dehydrogenase [Amedibacillus sp. YH-ame6]